MTLDELIEIEKKAAAAKTIREYDDVTHMYRHWREESRTLDAKDCRLHLHGETKNTTICGVNEESSMFAYAMRLAAIAWLDERIAYREKQFAEMVIPDEVPA